MTGILTKMRTERSLIKDDDNMEQEDKEETINDEEDAQYVFKFWISRQNWHEQLHLSPRW